jgi:serine/threonine-protein kinase
MAMDVPGTLGKYEIRRVLRRDGARTFYDGWDPSIGRRVTIKAVRRPGGADPASSGQIARLRREAQIAGRLTHPNIVGLYDFSDSADPAYVVMESVDGPTLKDLLDKGERLPLDRVARLMGEVLAGLRFCHENGVVHGGISPANTVLGKAGHAKILGFGADDVGPKDVDRPAAPPGTSAYLSPEQLRGEAADARADIYSAGAVLYHVLTGRKPFEGSAAAIAPNVPGGEPPPPSRLSAGCPPALDEVVGKAMARRPRDRFASADLFAEALRRAVASPDAVSRQADEPRSGEPRTLPGVARGSTVPLPVAVAAAFLVVIAGGGAGWLLSHRANAPPEQRAPPTATPAPPSPTQRAEQRAEPVAEPPAMLRPASAAPAPMVVGPTEPRASQPEPAPAPATPARTSDPAPASANATSAPPVGPEPPPRGRVAAEASGPASAAETAAVAPPTLADQPRPAQPHAAAVATAAPPPPADEPQPATTEALGPAAAMPTLTAAPPAPADVPATAATAAPAGTPAPARSDLPEAASQPTAPAHSAVEAPELATAIAPPLAPREAPKPASPAAPQPAQGDAPVAGVAPPALPEPPEPAPSQPAPAAAPPPAAAVGAAIAPPPPPEPPAPPQAAPPRTAPAEAPTPAPAVAAGTIIAPPTPPEPWLPTPPQPTPAAPPPPASPVATAATVPPSPPEPPPTPPQAAPAEVPPPASAVATPTVIAPTTLPEPPSPSRPQPAPAAMPPPPSPVATATVIAPPSTPEPPPPTAVQPAPAASSPPATAVPTPAIATLPPPEPPRPAPLRAAPGDASVSAAAVAAGGIAAVTAPVHPSTAAPQALPPPAEQPADRRQTASLIPTATLQQIGRILRGARCALADTATQEGGGPSVQGLADAATAASLRRQIDAVAGAPPLEWRLRTVDPVFCPALVLLRPISVSAGAAGHGVGLSLAGDRTTLQDGDAVLPRIFMMDFAGELRVDYLSHDGSLAHLYPTLAEPAANLAAQPARRLAAGALLALGDPGPGKPQWQSGVPYGTDMIVAVASSAPLAVAAPRNTEEKSAAYLADLGRAIERARAAGVRVSGALLLVDAVPKPN